MKHSLPLLALLAASTLATPILAQDMSSFLNPRAMAAQLGLGNSPSVVHSQIGVIRAPLGYSLNAPRIAVTQGVTIAALTPDFSVLAPRTSITPIRRGSIARITTIAPTHTAPMADLMAEVRDAAPVGANIAVISGANTAVISGANTAVIHSSPNVVTSPRLTLWQRIFGL